MTKTLFWICHQIVNDMLNDPMRHAKGIEILEMLVADGKAMKTVHKSGRVSYTYGIPAPEPDRRKARNKRGRESS